MYDVIVVGSGPAGTFSAYALEGKNVLVLDVGHRPPSPAPDFQGNLYSLRQQRADLFEELIGTEFEGLRNLHQPSVSLKLKAPYMSYIVRDLERLMPVQSSNFQAAASFAVGGLANAWGAGVFRFSSRDLDGFPISTSDLEPFYNEIASHIGISGVCDDLEPYFGPEPTLLPPTRIPPLASDILERFRVHRKYFQERRITIGRTRLAVLTAPHNGRSPYAYDNLEFYRSYNPAIYNPAFTLDDLVARNRITLQTGYFVSHYRQVGERIEVIAQNQSTGSHETFQCKNLILAAGTLGSTRIVLKSSLDYESRLPILDNPMVCIPFVRPGKIGARLEVDDGALGQLNVVYEDQETGDLLQAGIYGTTGPLRSDVLFQFPLSVSANLAWVRYLAPAMTLMMLFYPGHRAPGNYIRLTPDGALDINYDWKSSGRPERHLISAFRKLGQFSMLPICQYPPMGSSMHYAGSLPMSANPGPYETDAEGRLFGTKSVYVADGSCFSELPAKNLTFTIMANAARVAGIIRRTLD